MKRRIIHTITLILLILALIPAINAYAADGDILQVTPYGCTEDGVYFLIRWECSTKYTKGYTTFLRYTPVMYVNGEERKWSEAPHEYGNGDGYISQNNAYSQYDVSPVDHKSGAELAKQYADRRAIREVIVPGTSGVGIDDNTYYYSMFLPANDIMVYADSIMDFKEEPSLTIDFYMNEYDADNKKIDSKSAYYSKQIPISWTSIHQIEATVDANGDFSINFTVPEVLADKEHYGSYVKVENLQRLTEEKAFERRTFDLFPTPRTDKTKREGNTFTYSASLKSNSPYDGKWDFRPKSVTNPYYFEAQVYFTNYHPNDDVGRIYMTRNIQGLNYQDICTFYVEGTPYAVENLTIDSITYDDEERRVDLEWSVDAPGFITGDSYYNSVVTVFPQRLEIDPEKINFGGTIHTQVEGYTNYYGPNYPTPEKKEGNRIYYKTYRNLWNNEDIEEITVVVQFIPYKDDLQYQYKYDGTANPDNLVFDDIPAVGVIEYFNCLPCDKGGHSWVIDRTVLDKEGCHYKCGKCGATKTEDHEYPDQESSGKGYEYEFNKKGQECHYRICKNCSYRDEHLFTPDDKAYNVIGTLEICRETWCSAGDHALFLIGTDDIFEVAHKLAFQPNADGKTHKVYCAHCGYVFEEKGECFDIDDWLATTDKDILKGEDFWELAVAWCPELGSEGIYANEDDIREAYAEYIKGDHIEKTVHINCVCGNKKEVSLTADDSGWNETLKPAEGDGVDGLEVKPTGVELENSSGNDALDGIDPEKVQVDIPDDEENALKLINKAAEEGKLTPEKIKEKTGKDELKGDELNVEEKVQVEILGEEETEDRKRVRFNIDATYSITVTSGGKTYDLLMDEPLAVNDPTEITLPLPEGFGEEGDDATITHTHKGRTYKYPGMLIKDNDGTLLVRFISEHGLSPFVVEVLKKGDGKDEHIVTFDAKGGKFVSGEFAGNGVATASVASRSYVERPDDPERKGYTFLGWPYENVLGKLDIFNFDTLLNKDLRLYADWKRNSGSGGSSSGSSSGSYSVSAIQPVAPVTGASSISVNWSVDENGKWSARYGGTDLKNTFAYIYVNGKACWYHFNDKGEMDTGWICINGAWYYLSEIHDGFFGSMQTGWHRDASDGQVYYLGADGRMATGWQQIEGTWYYFNNVAGGAWNLVDDRWVFSGAVAKPLGAMLTDTVTPDGYKVDAEGKWVQ